jgi:hypothetical protein
VINSKEDWWNALDKSWDQLMWMADDLLELSDPAHDTPGDSSSALTGRTVFQEMVHLKNTQDYKIVRYLNAIWGQASDEYARANKPGWGTLCNLCSEDGVLYDEESL